MPAERRSFLFLQGPLSPFFRELGRALARAGCTAHRVNFCGGDVLYWPWGNTHCWRGHAYEWPQWIAGLMERIRDALDAGEYESFRRQYASLLDQRI